MNLKLSMRVAFTLVATASFTFSNLLGQDSNSILGFKEKITSKILNETREIYIGLPEQKKTAVPLTLVLDGESLFTPVVSAVQFMNYSMELPLMPESIVVGIPNTDRNRDMPIPQVYGGKGEENFLHFLTEELIPHLKGKYKTNDQIILIGHSQGGLFASYAMAQLPTVFTMVIALDAPMSVDSKTSSLRQKITEFLLKSTSTQYYVSMETAYGWGSEWTSLSNASNAFRKEYPEESHESMPFKAIYDGLKILYKNFPPPKKDMTLIALLHYYDDLSKRYGFWYEVPHQVLVGSANRKILNTRKKDALELLDFAEEKYGASAQIAKLRERAGKLSENLDPLVEFYLNHPKPTSAEVKQYIGRWVGQLNVRDGQNLPMDMEVSVENGKGKMISVQPWPPYTKVEEEILFVKDGQLIWGRKNRGSGLVISKAKIGKEGNLAGHDELVGFVFPDDMPEEIKKKMEEVIATPNSFSLRRK